MRVTIKAVGNYTIEYDPNSKLFEGIDEHGDTLTTAKTQQEVEEAIKRASKSVWKLPIEAFMVQDQKPMYGRITSVNGEDWSFRFAYDSPDRTNIKLTMTYGAAVWERTDANEQLCKEIVAIASQVEELRAHAKLLREKMEKRIDRAYFGLGE